MKIRVLEWSGLIMTDMLSFLVVGLAFLYSFTEPVQEIKSRQLTQETLNRQEGQISQLHNQVKALKTRLAGQQKDQQPAPSKAASRQVYLRLFPGDVMVLAQGETNPVRLDQEGLQRWLKNNPSPANGGWEIVLSAEIGVAYDHLTGLAENLINNNKAAVRFGW